MNRREMLGSAGATALLPACDVLAGAPRITPAFEAALHIGPAQSGAGNHRWARIENGKIVGRVVQGRVLAGRLDWHVDPASGAVEVTVNCLVQCADGSKVELRDRTTHTGADALAHFPGLPTAPELWVPGDLPVNTASLTGRLDAADFVQGVVRLQAFEPR